MSFIKSRLDYVLITISSLILLNNTFAYSQDLDSLLDYLRNNRSDIVSNLYKHTYMLSVNAGIMGAAVEKGIDSNSESDNTIVSSIELEYKNAAISLFIRCSNYFIFASVGTENAQNLPDIYKIAANISSDVAILLSKHMSVEEFKFFVSENIKDLRYEKLAPSKLILIAERCKNLLEPEKIDGIVKSEMMR